MDVPKIKSSGIGKRGFVSGAYMCSAFPPSSRSDKCVGKEAMGGKWVTLKWGKVIHFS